jgi:hypothetical protein
MKAVLEFDLPGEQEELDAAVRAIELKRCLEEICDSIVAWRCGKPEPTFPGARARRGDPREGAGFAVDSREVE